jgi:hypothetical protein
MGRDIYKPDLSPTWKSAGQIDVLSALGLSDLVDEDRNGEVQPYGRDNIAINSGDMNQLTLSSQSVAGLTSKALSIALFGLSDQASNLGEEKTITLLSSFQAAYKLNMSRSFSYTAGMWAYAHSTTSTGAPSLVLGGYDTTVIEDNSTLAVDIRDTGTVSNLYRFAVNITGITVKVDQDVDQTVESYNPVELPIYLESGMAVNIDSTTAQIWLPRSACDVFEKKFNLQWNEKAQLYFVNSTNYERMAQQNATIEFSLSSTRSNGVSKNFTVHWSAFLLTLEYPLADNKTRYFALRRATRADQYILGRAFLQSTHLSVDYDSKYFNISRRRFGPANESANIVAIMPKETRKSEPSGLSGLSKGAYAGVVLGVVVALLVGLLLLAWRMKWWPFIGSNSKDGIQAQYHKAELHDNAVARVEVMEKERVELETKEPIVEAVGAASNHRHDIEGLNEVHGMHADEIDHQQSQRLN